MIFRGFKEGLMGVFRHIAMSISSAIAVTVTLLIISIFLLLSFHLEKFTKTIETSMQISVMVDKNYENRSDEDQLQKKISALEGVASVTFSSKEEELNYFINTFDDERTREVFEPYKQDNPMHDAFYVEATDGKYIKDIAKKIEGFTGVDSVNYGGQSTINLVSAMSSIRRFGSILVIGLTLLAIFLIQNTIKLTIYARQDEINIMKNVGATNRFIRSPFLWEGIFIGILGSLIPIALTIYGYYFLYVGNHGILLSNMFVLEPPFPFLYFLAALLAAVGMLVGLFGSWLSVSRYLRLRR